MTTSPSEPARGPHDDPKVTPPAPPLYRPAAIALVVSAFPWLLVGARTSVQPFQAMDDSIRDVMSFAVVVLLLASPFVAWLLAHRALTRLRAMDVDERPPGLHDALARAPREAGGDPFAAVFATRVMDAGTRDAFGIASLATLRTAYARALDDTRARLRALTHEHANDARVGAHARAA